MNPAVRLLSKYAEEKGKLLVVEQRMVESGLRRENECFQVIC